MNIIKYAFSILLMSAILIGCTDHRDLHVVSSPMLFIENDWVPSRTNITRTGGDVSEDYQDPKATVVVYPLPSPIFWLEDHRYKLISLDQGEYHILVLNDYLYSENQSFLKNIRYRGTNTFDTFEAYATTMGNTFKPRAGETIVNNPDTLATRSTIDFSIEGKRTFQMKYKNGKNGFPTTPSYVEDSLLFVPCRVVHSCVVRVHALNIKALNGVGKARASLRGFSGSAFLANRMPSHSEVTHQFNLNSMVLDQDVPANGTISARFSTFGPPLDLPDRTYELEINVLYPSGREAPPFIIDVTDQLTAQIEQMNADRLADRPIMADILIQVEITLDSDKGDWDVSVDDWGDDIIITIPMDI